MDGKNIPEDIPEVFSEGPGIMLFENGIPYHQKGT